MRMQKQIFYSFLLIIAIPTFVFLVIILEISTNVIEARTVSASELVVKESVKRIDTHLNNYRKASMQIYYNENVMKLLNSDSSLISRDNLVIDEILGSIVNADKYLMSAVLKAEDNLVVKGTDILGIEGYLESIHSGRQEADGRLEWIPSRKMKTVFGLDSWYFGAVRQIRRDDREIGELLFFIRGEFFNDIYAGAIPNNSGKDLILSPQGMIVSSPDENLIGTKNTDERMAAIIGGELGTGGYVITGSKRDSDYLIFSRSEESGWYFIREIKEKEILSGIIRLRQSLVVLIILFSLFLIFLSYFFSRGLSRPLNQLTGYVDTIGKEEIESPVSQGRLVVDEILKLDERLSAMFLRIQNLIREVSQNEQLKTQAELKALRNHISPHFIYNSLDTIRWMAVINKQDNIRDMTVALDRLMRYAADSDTVMITLFEELEIIREYIYIQKMRYSDIELQLEVPEDVGENLVNKFILQMIVENSIVHGFRDSDRTGIITIQAKIEGEVLLLYVEDNGCGIDPGMIYDDKHEHTGLDSVNKRLILNYGDDFGVSMKSTYGEGTCVTLRLPVMR